MICKAELEALAEKYAAKAVKPSRTTRKPGFPGIAESTITPRNSSMRFRRQPTPQRSMQPFSECRR